MAATETRNRAARRRALRTLRLPCLAAGVGALVARDARAQQSTAETRVLFYKESNGRTQVIDPVVLLNQSLGSWGELGLTLGYDAISGASPTGGYPTGDVTTSASGRLIASGTFPQAKYSDTRKSAGLSWGRRFGAHLPTIDVSYAKENDYTARAAGLSDSWTLFGGRGTLHYGASFARDIVAPVKNPLTNPTGLNLSYAKSENGYSLGWTWIFGERDIADVSASVQRLSGYLDDPYKVVPVGPASAPTSEVAEHRPDSRLRRALVLKYGHHYPGDSAVKATYRFYSDDWGVQAHMVEVEYDQRLFEDWSVAPLVRFYTQSRANFYASRLAAPSQFMSADYRLSPFSNVLGGLTISYRLQDTLSLSLGGTYQTQTGRDRVTPVSTTPPVAGAPVPGPTAAADMNVLTITAGVKKLF